MIWVEVNKITNLITSALIILASSYIGIACASKYETAVKHIEAFQSSLKMLEFDVSYLKLPLRESFERIAKSQRGCIKNFYSYLAEQLRDCNGENVGFIYKKALNRFKYDLLFNENIENALIDFSDSLGNMNVENEVANIKALYTKIKYYEEEARGMAKKNVKMYRGLGILGGIFIVLIFS